MDLLDDMMIWNQFSNIDNLPETNQPSVSDKAARSVSDWMNETDVFSAFNLQSQVFSHLPATNVKEMSNA
ncbi:MAG: hypothetical protein PSV17_12855 [Methylotenera sp.]|uniref:hypothetical protein n=1 Tax=Methylotenera sp. TaxID=2051956 RepID=UPI002489791C|nr:hypothetical protein [Methylotenera sp.]MDI1310300.1 hypothetical protein [Methylotenera sp.]